MVWFPNWTTTPIPGVSLSASGLLALADLSTVAQRTAITGGSSWLDSLLLAPGLHYQQAAEEFARGGSSDAASGSSIIDAVEEQDGQPVRFQIRNAATALYIQKIARPGQIVTLHVGAAPHWGAVYRMKRSNSGLHATVWEEDDMPDLGWVSHVLYLISPVLTVASLAFVILLQDWWALASLLALMLSRILNIWVIKQRTKRRQPPPPISTSSTAATSTVATPKPEFMSLASQAPQPRRPRNSPPNHLTEYTISLGDGSAAVRLRGIPSDLQAITVDAWLRAKTHIEGYLEAAAKLLVYLVAAFSGNTTQAGAIIMMGLLLSTAGLLALSNANAKSFQMNGRVAAPDVFKKGCRSSVEGEKTMLFTTSASNGHGPRGRVIKGEAFRQGQGEDNGGEKKVEEDEGISSTGRGNNTWPPSSSPRIVKSRGGEVGLGLQAGVVDNAHDQAEKGEIRHAGSHTL